MTKIKNFFKSITNSKKKIFALALSVCVVVLSIAGSSIAYFTDTAEYTNTFTSGNVKIMLKVNGTEITDSNKNIEDDDVYPGKVIPKATVIHNVGNNSAYLGAIITVTAPDTFFTTSTVKNMFAGLPTVHVNVTESTSGGKDTFKIYVIFADAYAKDATANVFTSLSIPTTWNNADMEKLGEVSFDVNAYAVQTSGMTGTALDALKLGFPSVFDDATMTP